MKTIKELKGIIYEKTGYTGKLNLIKSNVLKVVFQSDCVKIRINRNGEDLIIL